MECKNYLSLCSKSIYFYDRAYTFMTTAIFHEPAGILRNHCSLAALAHFRFSLHCRNKVPATPSAVLHGGRAFADNLILLCVQD